MGSIKQLLPYKGCTLVEYAIQQAQASGFDPVVVVLGAQAEAVGGAVAHTSALSVVNENWASGMGSSITCGAAKILELRPDMDSLAVLLADQPLVTAEHLKKMGRVFLMTNAPIVAAAYAGTLGVPAFFRRSVFHQLQALKPEAGARALLRGGDAEVLVYDLPEAAIDVDTPEDFAAVKRLPA
jgi:molybdenum cofactor cytidylyltransferase